jgi:type VI secretion system FHA domain protein
MSVFGAIPHAPVSAIFDAAGGDIGRGADCTLVLADPERRISRRQALVACRDGRHFIRRIGTNLTIELDGVPLPPDVDVPLHAGAQIRIGPYLLHADETASPADLNAAADALPRVGLLDVPAEALHAPNEPRLHELDLVVGDPTGNHPRPTPDTAAPAHGARPPTVPELLSALYAGLRMPAPAASEQTEPDLERIGALLRSAVAGTLALLATRSIAKRELGASVTLPQTRGNNPLKFAPDLDTALAHLLGPAQRGFVAPLVAMNDAFDDLRAHELSVLAGMRAALNEVLSRFDPAALEDRLAPKTLWERLRPGRRESKNWAHYVKRYPEITRDIESDFDSLFGRAFREAYEAQLAALASTGSHAAAGRRP